MVTHNGIQLESLQEIEALDEPDSVKAFLAASFEGETYEPENLEIAAETSMYYKRRQDGLNAYFQITSELRLLQIGGALTREQNRAIEDTLAPVRDEIVLGQWRTACEKLVEIGISGPVTQQMYDRFYGIIADYLAGPNYEQ